MKDFVFSAAFLYFKKVTWQEIVEPVADLAENGFPMSRIMSTDLEKFMKPIENRPDIAHLK